MCFLLYLGGGPRSSFLSVYRIHQKLASDAFCSNLAILGSVPNTPCPVVGGALLPCCLHLFYRVVQEKVDQDGVCMGLGVLPAYLPANQLHAPYAAS